MIEVVLPVVLLRVNPPALHVFSVLQTRAFPRRDHTVGLGSVFLRLQPVLSAFEARGFPGGERAGLHALLYALFLVGLALIESGRRIRLGQRGKR
jgi:hypothetical protein